MGVHKSEQLLLRHLQCSSTQNSSVHPDQAVLIFRVHLTRLHAALRQFRIGQLAREAILKISLASLLYLYNNARRGHTFKTSTMERCEHRKKPLSVLSCQLSDSWPIANVTG